MRTFKQEGDTLPLTAPAGGVVAGVGYVLVKLFVVALNTAVAGDTFQGRRRGVITLAKLSTDTFAQGALVYWDDTNKRVTSTASGNSLIGTAAVALGSGTVTADVVLNGTSLP